MEAGDGTDDPPPSLPLPPGKSPVNVTGKDESSLDSSTMEPLSDTYVVQIPRDQIYRVPPPENARKVQCFRKPSQGKKQCGCSPCCKCFIVAVVVVAVIIGVIFGVIHFLYNPKSPKFAVSKVVVKNPHQHKHPGYEISFKANNPNERVGVTYQKGGQMSLFFKKNKLAKGEYPSFHQEPENSTTLRVTLAGSNVALPKEVEKSMNNTKSKKTVSLSIKFNVPIKFTSWVRNLSKDMTVTCDFRVDTLGKGTKILFQECSTTI